MTLDEARRRLRSYLRYRKPDPDDNFWEAVQLGEEALKRVRGTRDIRFSHTLKPLPGETEK